MHIVIDGRSARIEPYRISFEGFEGLLLSRKGVKKADHRVVFLMLLFYSFLPGGPMEDNPVDDPPPAEEKPRVPDYLGLQVFTHDPGLMPKVLKVIEDYRKGLAVEE